MSKRITEDQKNTALKAYEHCGNQELAAREAGVSGRTLRNEMQRSKQFREAMQDAKAVYCAEIEELLNDLIKDPSRVRNVAYANIVMFKAKAEMPDKYRERIDHKVESDIKIIIGVPRPPIS